jgi:DNA-binding SARP family transcriptional activator
VRFRVLGPLEVRSDSGDAVEIGGPRPRPLLAMPVLDAALALGEHFGLITGLRELVEEHPLRERLCGQLMRALYAAGRQAEALAVFEDGRRRLADPSAELAEIHLAVLRGAEPSVHNGLPAQLASFVGREVDLARIARCSVASLARLG